MRLFIEDTCSGEGDCVHEFKSKKELYAFLDNFVRAVGGECLERDYEERTPNMSLDKYIEGQIKPLFKDILKGESVEPYGYYMILETQKQSRLMC